MSLAMIGMLFTACADLKEKKTDEIDDVAQTQLDQIATEIPTAEQGNVYNVIQDNEDLSTLAAAVAAGELESAFSSEGPITVFAPTNEAFQKLGEEKLKSLLSQEGRSTLHAILTYHVVEGDLDATAIIREIEEQQDGYQVNTIQGATLTFTLEDENVVITDSNGNKATIVLVNSEASNGMIHAIDGVLVPEK